ncbi:MAG TPA: tRNA-dihydrouridine synthase family protein [Vicinamibacteria bacterium]|nr:tRNA-dihydrouridine synthase family protein [Vicinamibacteria bacterium]
MTGEGREGSPFAGKVWLAPLTFGGNLPFRRLCVELGAEVTVSEMAVVKKLLKDRNSEFALLRSHPSEPFFGVQLADRSPDSLAEGARIAEAKGARFIDLNCGCPIDQMTRRGLGASLLQKPGRLARLVAAMVAAVKVPVTVKLRLGWREGHENASALAKGCEEAGAAAIAIHGRTREQRYSRAADWDAIGRVAAERGVPVVGNGDILTPYEARDRRARSGVTAVMLGRGALIKPWLFREIREDREWLPTAEERFTVLWRFVELLRDHFGDDERGRTRIQRFLPWHLGFFCRYRPFPEAEHAEASRRHPLLQTRPERDLEVSPLDTLLRDARATVHETLSAELVGSATREEALERALRLQATLPATAEIGETREPVAEVAG